MDEEVLLEFQIWFEKKILSDIVNENFFYNKSYSNPTQHYSRIKWVNLFLILIN